MMDTMRYAVDRPARDIIKTALDTTLVVEAAAGTGKTHELVERVLAILARGQAQIHELVVVTFTEKAAGELKLRLRQRLEEARRMDGAAPYLTDALAHLEEAHINTIHGFCADLLRERPVEACVDPRFSALDEPQSQRLYAQAFTRWFQERMEKPGEGLRRAVRRLRDASSRLLDAGWKLCQWRDFPTSWGRPQYQREAVIDSLARDLAEFAELSARPARMDDNLFRSTEAMRVLCTEIQRREEEFERDYDGIESRLRDIISYKFKIKKGYSKEYAPGVKREIVHQAAEKLHIDIKSFLRNAEADLAALLRDELWETVARYDSLKAHLGVLDFVDLLLKVRHLLSRDERVRHDLQQRFRHIFVDEFQDTDPVQAEILILLAADDPAESDWRKVRTRPGKLFIVGDPKQAIYRFRRADVGIYQEVKALLLQQGAECLQLSTSFRSRPAIQNFVNAAFAPVMTGDAASLQASYVPLSPYRTDVQRDQPAVVALPVPEPYPSNWNEPTAKAIRESLPQAVAAFVHWLVNHSGWKVTEREDGGEVEVDIKPRHICLLFRNLMNQRDDVTRPYIEALQAREVDHLMVGGRTYHHEEEIDSIRAALVAIEWPDDELCVYATLRGPFFGIPDDVLFEYKRTYNGLKPYRIPSEGVTERLQPVVQALAILRELHRRRNYRPAADTLSSLMQATRAHASLILRPSGEKTLANVLHVCELARAFEAGGGVSFRGFVEWLRTEAEGREGPDVPILEEASDGVRMMTVHKAKGLEFPVVILADLASGRSRQMASRYVDAERGLCATPVVYWMPQDLLDNSPQELERDAAEEVRVCYVAATRARDLLVVPSVGDLPYTDSWLAPLQTVLHMGPGVASEPAPGCPAFNSDTVLVRPESLLHMSGVRPGLYRKDGVSLVWWDPSVLDLKVPEKFGVRRGSLLLDKDVPEEVLLSDLERYRRWREGLDRTLEQGRQPTVVLETVTQRARDWMGAAPEVEVLHVPKLGSRPSGARFGSLVHAVMSLVPLDVDRDVIDDVAVSQGRLLASPEDEVRHAAEAVAAALQHPLMERARRARLCRRETPATFIDSDGTMVEGVVDLAFLEGERWVVVDFKTDAQQTSIEQYRCQVALYLRAFPEGSSGILLFL